MAEAGKKKIVLTGGGTAGHVTPNIALLPALRERYDEEQQKYSRPMETELLPLANFYPAEEYHQKYLEKNPDGYCHIPDKYMHLV